MWWVNDDMSVMIVLGAKDGNRIYRLDPPHGHLAPEYDLACYDHIGDPTSGLREMTKVKSEIYDHGKFVGYLKVQAADLLDKKREP